MKQFLNKKLLPLLPVSTGAIALILRIWLYNKVDEKGLLPAGRFAEIAIFLLAALTFGILAYIVRSIRPVRKYAHLFPASILNAVGCGAGAVGILTAGIFCFQNDGGTMDVMAGVLGILAAASLAYTAFQRLRGRRPAQILEVIVLLFFMVYAVGRCRDWGKESQLIVYFFPLLTCVGLMVHAYNLAAAAAKNGKRRLLVFISQATLFCCVVSLNEPDWSFYLGMAIWLALDLCALDTKPLPPEPAEETE